MEESTTLLQIQQEIDILKSMYGGEVEDLRLEGLTPEERQYHTTAVRLHFTPLKTYSEQRPDCHIMCIIKLDTDNEYPTSPAKFTVEDYKGITPDELDELKVLLQEEMSKAADESRVVFYDICLAVKQYLQDHERPEKPSMYHVMEAKRLEEEQQRQQHEEEKLKQQLEKEQRRAKHIEEENDRYINEKREERRDAAAQSRSSSVLRSPSTGMEGITQQQCTSPRRNRSSYSFSESSSCLLDQVLTLTTNGKQEKVIEIQYIMHESKYAPHKTYAVVDRKTRAPSVLHCWTVNIKQSYINKRAKRSGQVTDDDVRISDFKSRIATLEIELAMSFKNLSSEFLVEYEAYSVVETMTEIVIYLLQPFIQTFNLSRHYKRRIPVTNESYLTLIAKGCLSSLAYLHQRTIVHRDLRETCIYYDYGEENFRIADYSVERRLLEAVMNYNNKEPASVYPATPGKSGQKKDVFRLGVILISVFRGKRPKNVSPRIPSRLSPNFRELLSYCLDPDEATRWHAERLLQHPLFSTAISPVITSSSNSSSDEEGSSSSNRTTSDRAGKRRTSGNARKKQAGDGADAAAGEAHVHYKDISDTSVPINSRLEKDYDTIEEIGRGGFGRVYKVRNKVDKRLYALKHISLHSESRGASNLILKEVQCLSLLSHEHVVRYYTSWIEEITLPPGDNSTGDEDSFTDVSVNAKTTRTHEVTSNISFDFHDFHGEDNNDDDDYNNDDDDDDESDFIVFENGDGDEEPESDSPSSKKHHAVNRVLDFEQKKSYLFIQMEFCDNKTLRQAIDGGLNAELVRLWRLFREIVYGLDYIHSLNLIHQDLKPGNIFIDSNDHVKIGDFGLTTVVKGTANKVNIFQNSKDGSLSTSTADRGAPCNVGTFFYMAPEVLPPNKASGTTKLDIYSLGIIFFEMVCPQINSGHERVIILNNVRRREIKLPSEFEQTQYDQKKNLLEWLLNHNPQSRPTTAQLLKSDLLPPLSTDEKMFKEKLNTILDKSNSDQYQEILRSFFTQREIAMKEVSFMHLYKPTKLERNLLNFAKEHIRNVFVSHGAIWLPAPSFVPKDSFYSSAKDDKKLFNVVSENGNPMTSCPELRYPFARLAAMHNLCNIRRYCIDRIHLLCKFNTDFPCEIYECAFDIIGDPSELSELCARIMIVGQDAIKPLADSSCSLKNITIAVTYLPLSKAILNICRVSKGDYCDAFAIIKTGLRAGLDTEEICNQLVCKGISEKSCNVLKQFIQMNGSVEEILSQLKDRNVKHRSKDAEIESKVSELYHIVNAAATLGVEYKMTLRPLLLPENLLYSNFMCQFVLQAPLLAKKKERKEVVLASGGVFDDLITLHRACLPQSQVVNKVVSAVGISITLENLVAKVFRDSEPDSPLPVVPLVKNIGCGGSDITVFVVYVGEDTGDMGKLLQRIELVRELRANNIAADFGYIEKEEETHKYKSPYIVLLHPNIDRFIIKYGWNDRGFWSSEKRVLQAEAAETLLSLMPSEQDSKTGCINTSLLSTGSFVDDFITCEIISRKVSKQKSLLPEEQNRRERDVTSLLSRWGGSFKGHHVIVVCLELEKNSMFKLASLDLDSNARNFNDSLAVIKESLSGGKEQTEYVERCARIISKKIENFRPERPGCLIAYSIPSDAYKRIY